jgi:hypothetical protein
MKLILTENTMDDVILKHLNYLYGNCEPIQKSWGVVYYDEDKGPLFYYYNRSKWVGYKDEVFISKDILTDFFYTHTPYDLKKAKEIIKRWLSETYGIDKVDVIFSSAVNTKYVSESVILEHSEVDNILDKMNSGIKLSIDEKKCLNAYSEHIRNGGKDYDFQCPELEYDDREGMEFVSDLPGLPKMKFTFSEELDHGVETHYAGEIKFNGKEYFGVIITDKNGYVIGYDFYNVDDEEDYRLQDVTEGLEHEIKTFFEDEVIPNLK